MLTKSLSVCREIVAADGTTLRELLHPERDPARVRFSLAHAKLKPGSWSLLHRLQSNEVYCILAGSGTMEIDGEQREVQEGDVIYIPPGGRQRILARGPDELKFLCIVDPAWRAEDEEKLEMKNGK
jgi:mannose-6-phosphate isomerase-like protein (cupin superfamily)